MIDQMLDDVKKHIENNEADAAWGVLAQIGEIDDTTSDMTVEQGARWTALVDETEAISH